MSFTETFMATSSTLFCAWIFKKYIEPLLDKNHAKIHDRTKQLWSKKK